MARDKQTKKKKKKKKKESYGLGVNPNSCIKRPSSMPLYTPSSFACLSLLTSLFEHKFSHKIDAFCHLLHSPRYYMGGLRLFLSVFK